MNYKRIIIFPILFLLLAFIEVGCWDYDTNYYDWNNITLENLEYNYEGDLILFEKTEKEVFYSHGYGVNLKFEYELLAGILPHRLSFVKSACAMTKPSDEYILKDKVADIRIITIKEFDENHLQGSDISAYFNLDPEYLESLLNGTNGLNNTKTIESQLAEEINLFLSEDPSRYGIHQFEVCVIFESGKIIKELTTEIELIKNNG